jgi:outer membrane immunogenic protein
VRRLLVAIIVAASAVVFSQIASAADLPVKAPAYVPPSPAYSWTGLYIGGNVGYSWGDARTDLTGTVTNISAPDLLPFQNPPIPFAGSHSQWPDGFVAGVQVGYNYQISPQWVLGFEADIQGSAERTSHTFADPLSGTLCTAISMNAY